MKKSTLASYVNKANRDSNIDSHQAGGHAAWAGFGGGDNKKMAMADAKKLLKHADKRAKGIKRAVGKLAKEDVEQVDELSKGTLGSYVKKASQSATDHGAEYGKKKADQDSVNRSLNRHGMTSQDKDDAHKAFKTSDSDVRKPEMKAVKRLKGINRAVKRLTKEEQINELSRDTLKSYKKKSKAARDNSKAQSTYHLGQSADQADRGDTKSSDKYFDHAMKHNDNAQKRQAGIDLAKKKIAKRNEALTPAQDKHLDVHDDGKIDKKDFKKLRDMRKNKSDK